MGAAQDMPAEPGGYAARILARLAAAPDQTATHWRGRATTAGSSPGP